MIKKSFSNKLIDTIDTTFPRNHDQLIPQCFYVSKYNHYTFSAIKWQKHANVRGNEKGNFQHNQSTSFCWAV